MSLSSEFKRSLFWMTQQIIRYADCLLALAPVDILLIISCQMFIQSVYNIQVICAITDSMHNSKTSDWVWLSLIMRERGIATSLTPPNSGWAIVWFQITSLNPISSNDEMFLMVFFRTFHYRNTYVVISATLRFLQRLFSLYKKQQIYNGELYNY